MTMRRYPTTPLLIGLSLLGGCGKGNTSGDQASPPVMVRVQGAQEGAASRDGVEQNAASSVAAERPHVVATSVFAAPGPVPRDDPASDMPTTPAATDAASVDMLAPPPEGPLPEPVPTPLAPPPVSPPPSVPDRPLPAGPKGAAKVVAGSALKPQSQPQLKPAPKPMMVSPVGNTSAYPVGPTVPVKPGYYALGGTPCEKVSARTVLVFYRDGMDSAAGSCAWSDVKALRGGHADGAKAWRVTRRCVVGQQEGVSDGTPYTRSARLALTGDGAFTLSDEGRAKPLQARWCSQASLPEPWRSQPPIGG